MLLHGLQSIPRSVMEAAAIDGAKPMRRFWTVIFPLLSPTIFFLLVVNIVYAFFDTFGIIDTMTRGGPAKSTETLVYKVYVDGLLGGNLGFFFQAEDGIRDWSVTGVQTCALPI